MNRRKVKILDNLTYDCMIILTDASPEHIRQWIESCKLRNAGEQDNFDTMAKECYIKVLYNSEEDLPENETAIGCDEEYELYGREIRACFAVGRKALLRQLDEAVTKSGMVVIDRLSDGFIVKNNGIGPDFMVVVKEA